MQNDSSAAKFDFGILSKSSKLILIQCKKASSYTPNDSPNKNFIYHNRNKISDKFHKAFNVKIQTICLIFITGISFYIEEKTNEIKDKTLGNKDSENFEELEKLCKKGECMLIYYDPNTALNYIKNDEGNFIPINSLINLSGNYEEIFIEDNIGNLQEIKEKAKFNKDINKLLSDKNIFIYEYLFLSLIK